MFVTNLFKKKGVQQVINALAFPMSVSEDYVAGDQSTPKLTHADMLVIRANLMASEEATYKALLEQDEPVNARQLSDYMGKDSASVTPRLPRLRDKGLAKIAYKAKGKDRRWRNYYVAVKRDH